MQKGHNKVSIRSYRLTPDLEKQWSSYLEASGLSQNQAIKEAVTMYLSQFITPINQGK